MPWLLGTAVRSPRQAATNTNNNMVSTVRKFPSHNDRRTSSFTQASAHPPLAIELGLAAHLLLEETSAKAGFMLYEAATRGLATALGVRTAYVSAIAPEDSRILRTLAHWDTGRFCEERTYCIEGSPCEITLTNELCFISDVSSFNAQPQPPHDWSVQSYLAVPLHDEKEIPFGVLALADDKPIPEYEDVGNLLRIIGGRISLEYRRQRFEGALQANEARLGFLLDTSPVTIYTCEPFPPFKAKYVSWNVQRLMGYAPNECLNDPDFWARNIHPDDQERIFSNIPVLLEKGSLAHEYRFRTASGDYRWIHDELRLSRAADGTPIELIGYWVDVDDRKQAQLMLEASRDELADAQRLARIGSWTVDLGSEKCRWSNELYSFLGVDPATLDPNPRSFLKYVHPEDLPAVARTINNAADEPASSLVHRIVQPSGEVRYVKMRTHAYTNAAGELVRMTAAVQDITDEKLARQALGERERRLQQVIKGTKVGTWELDLMTGRIEINARSALMLGYSPSEASGLTVKLWEQLTHPDDIGMVMDNILGHLSGLHDYIDVQYRMRHREGHWTWVHDRGGIVRRSSDERPLVLSGIHADIQRQKAAELAIKESQDKAQAAQKAKSDFMSEMSHEFRSPLNAILGFSQLLLGDAQMTEESKQSVREIIGAGKQLLDLINDVLDLARVESGNIELHMEHLRLDAIIDDCLPIVSLQAKQRDIQIVRNGCEGVHVRADRRRLRQVLLNLLSNAIKYNCDGGRVDIAVAAIGSSRVDIRISDTGYGIAPEKFDELFKPFQRLGAEAAGIEGTGIGLTISRQLVEMMGGKVGVVSHVGVGSTFWVELSADASTPDSQKRTSSRHSNDHS